ncbi:hypothetical protein PFAG_00294 [Plasmodium falciparum Santa Lucia]|uniref:Uncharacterized protein n=1 Tax=Plasmodium falciparum Santa Lucia TaxID=478859 RepID=W7G5G5_PLAFA|nr:hypothetical protein PFAG_00294 [Plasmodium falciparum Santa Lucia]
MHTHKGNSNSYIYIYIYTTLFLFLLDVLDQYSKLIKNIKDCPDMKAVNDELNKFANYLSI